MYIFYLSAKINSNAFKFFQNSRENNIFVRFVPSFLEHAKEGKVHGRGFSRNPITNDYP